MAAGAIITAGLAQVAAIYSASSTGGASAPAVYPVTPGASSDTPRQEGAVVTVNVYGNFYGDESFEDLMRETVVDAIDTQQLNLQTSSGESIERLA